MTRPKKRSGALALRSTTLTSPRPRVFALSGVDDLGLFEREIRSVELTGALSDHQTARACNVIESAIHDFHAERVNFARCDFKDTAIRSSRFSDTNFGSSSLAYNTILKTVFDRCTFHDTDIQNCEFDQTVFVGCDLRFLLIKACSFTRCEFRDCETNNQLFEMCRLSECTFANTELQVQSVAENFGLLAKNYGGALRDDRADGPHGRIQVAKLKTWLRSAEIPALQKLSVEYFVAGILLDGSQNLDAALDLDSWLRMFRTAGSFAVVLNRWVEFLLGLYERDALTVHVVVRLHSMTDGLLRGLSKSAPHHQTIAAINGVHLSLSRIVDEYLVAVEQCTALANREVSFLVEGHQTRAFYYRSLSPFFARSPARITKLVRHNSPWDLGLTFPSSGGVVVFMALFLATRTRIELHRLIQKLEDRATAPRAKPKTRRTANHNPVIESLVALEFGGAGRIRETPHFRLKAYLPGNLVAELKLDIASSRIAKLRKIVKDLL